MRLDLGGGKAPAPGHLNVDIMKGADIVHDLNQGLPRWVMNKKGVEGIRCHQLLEHLETIVPLMNDAYMAMNPGAEFELSTPYALSEQCWTDPTHKRGYTPTTFQYFIKDSPFQKEKEEYGIIAEFESVKAEIVNDWNIEVVFKK